MKVSDVNVTELKVRLSKYMRLASRGARIIVRDRDEPVAELRRSGRLQSPGGWPGRAGSGAGTQDWRRLKISKIGKSIDIQASLRAVREDPNEIRRR